MYGGEGVINIYTLNNCNTHQVIISLYKLMLQWLIILYFVAYLFLLLNFTPSFTFYHKKSTTDDHNDIYDLLLKYETNNAETYEACKAFLEDDNWIVKQNRRGEFE